MPLEENMEYAIRVQDVTKVYRLYDKPIDRLKESLSLSHRNYHKPSLLSTCLIKPPQFSEISGPYPKLPGSSCI